MVVNLDTTVGQRFQSDHKLFCDHHVPLTRTISLSNLFQAEAAFLDRVRSGERNVRVLVSRDVNVMRWLQTDANNPMTNVCLEVDFLNTDSLTEATIGDVFVSKVQRTAHQKVIHELARQFIEWCSEEQFSLLTCAEVIGPGCILRPDVIVYRKAASPNSPCLIIDVEIQNRTPSGSYDRFLRYFDCCRSLVAAIGINIFNVHQCSDSNQDEQTCPEYSAIAVVYRRAHSGQIVVDDAVDFGMVPLDSETLADLPAILSEVRMRLLEPRLDSSCFTACCPWSDDELPFIMVNTDQLRESNAYGAHLEPFSIDLWKLLSAVQKFPHSL